MELKILKGSVIKNTAHKAIPIIIPTPIPPIHSNIPIYYTSKIKITSLYPYKNDKKSYFY